MRDRSAPDRPLGPAAYALPRVAIGLTRVMKGCGVTDEQAAAAFGIKRTTWILVRSRRGYYPGHRESKSAKQQAADRAAFRARVEAWVQAHPTMSAWLASRTRPLSAIWEEEATHGLVHRLMPVGFARNGHSPDPARAAAAEAEGALIPWEVAMIDTKTLRHFKLFRNPFLLEIERDKDLYMGEEQQYVADCLWEMAHHSGFVALVGEVGAGKSTLRDKLFRDLAREDQVRIVFPQTIDKMRLTAESIADAIIYDVSGEKPRVRLEAKARQMTRLLRDRAAAGHRHLLVIEEAHLLPQRTLRYLKQFWELTLSTGEGTTRLLGILLVGQLELKQRLEESGEGFDMREMVRRCQLVELGPMNGDTRAYLQHLLKRAGAELDKIIEPAAVDALAQRLTVAEAHRKKAVSHTYPLTLHRWLAKAMGAAAKRGEPKVTAELIHELGTGGAR
ncbi:MAG: ExeA family protein [Candidatus Methylomirabilis oxyfera]|nr:ExeA family protein [Candidatus Methylomirabilis oxyfera]